MPLNFQGIDPETGDDNSPTVWVDDETRDILVQAWDADDATVTEISAKAWAPGHTPGIPAGESVIRIPARMVPILRKACDAAERTDLR
ncbi:hypothetical protein P3T37_001317 [Kitasatospora sp. MAA4]|uniref:hypothetical protein n=1 Tax=Kitasatospora sp. MAA4 TaxID=3035093 RepID=UPI0024763694|nr:hypothetical protein [Kitasatospora sp. MAA4]MDH6131943.1 hypothetical protein [Kitasatospora sp. MAA4]